MILTIWERQEKNYIRILSHSSQSEQQIIKKITTENAGRPLNKGDDYVA